MDITHLPDPPETSMLPWPILRQALTVLGRPAPLKSSDH